MFVSMCWSWGEGGGGGRRRCQFRDMWTCANLIKLVVEAVELAGIGEVTAHQVCQLLPLPLSAIPAQSTSPSGGYVCSD